MKKKDVNREIIKLNDEELFCGPLGNVISNLQKLVAQYPEFHDLYIKMDLSWDYKYFHLYGIRPETDAEFNRRIENELLQQKRAEEKQRKIKESELQLLKKLKKKYESS